MEIIFGVILLLSILFLVFYCIKGFNLMVGFFLMAVVWTTIALIGNAVIGYPYDNTWFQGESGIEAILRAIQHVFQTGPQNFSASILANIFFGAFFGRVLIETNIAATIIKKTVELGGDRPRVTMALLSIVTALLFVNMTGIGPVMAIAVIVVPILLTIGIPASVALFLFVGSITAGIMANPINFAQYHGIIRSAVAGAFGVESDFYYLVANFAYGDYILFGFIGLVIILIGVNVTSNIALGLKKKSYAWAIDTEAAGSEQKDAPWYSWIAIFIPVVLITVFNTLSRADGSAFTQFSVIFSFILASIWAMLTTGYFKGGFGKVTGRLSKYFTDGAMDVAPMVGFLLALAMFNNAAGLNVPYLRAIVGGIIPNSATGLVLLFAFASIGAFFRGPINLVGSGAAFASIVFIGIGEPTALAMGVLFLYVLFSITTVVPQHLDITQSWVAWGLGYTNVSPKEYMKMSIPTGYIVSIVLCLLVLAFYSMGILF